MADILKNTDAHTQPSFSFKNRLYRFIWIIVYVLLFKFSPRPLHWWRSFLLRLFGAKIGKGCHIYPKARIWAPWNLEMGGYSCLADEVICESMDKITIGERVVISQGARLITGSHDYENPRFPLYTRPINIKSHVWIASEAFICQGVTIEEGAVIGARSVVTNDIPAWMVCVGDPCRPIKKRKMEK